MYTSAILLAGLLCAASLLNTLDAAPRKLGGAPSEDVNVRLSPTGDSCNCADGTSCWQCTGNYKICRHGQCQAGDVGEYCLTNGDCSSGLYCINYRCQGSQHQTCKGPGADHCSCAVNSQCASGFCNTANYQCQTLQCQNQAYCSAVAPGTICKPPGYCSLP